MKIFFKTLSFSKILTPRQYGCSSFTFKLSTLLANEENQGNPTENQSNPSENQGKMSIIRTIQSLFQLSYKNSLQIVNEHSRLTERSESFLKNNYQLLLENGVDGDVIQKYPLLLSVPFLKKAVFDLKTLPYNLSTTIVLACLEKPKLDRFISHYKKLENKIELISKIVEVPSDLACEFIYRKDFLISKDPQVLSETLKLILDFGIPLEEIRKDLWVLKYSPNVVRSRIELIQEQNIEISSRKPWMIRCPVKVIETYARRRIDNRHILGNDSITVYLSKKLECTEDQAKYLISKLPALRSKSLKTLTDILNLLYSKGLRPIHIYRVPKILVHSLDTTKKRLEQLEQSGVQINSLYMLTKSQRQFSQYIEAMSKGKK